jgi:hypothetical protein
MRNYMRRTTPVLLRLHSWRPAIAISIVLLWLHQACFQASHHISHILLQSIISGTVVLLHHIIRYSYTLTHIHILLQNSCHWPLCKSANVRIAAGNTAERHLQEGPIRLPLWQWWSPWPTEIDTNTAFLSSRERNRNRKVWNQVSMEGVAERWPVVLPAPLGQAHSNV